MHTHRRRDFIRNVHPADQFPLVLGITIAIANSVFIAVQCMSLNSVFVSGCRGTVQVVFPGKKTPLCRLTNDTD